MHFLFLSDMSCSAPPTVSNAVSDYNPGASVVLNTTLTYTCGNGFTMKDQNSNQQTITCVGVSVSVNWEPSIECEGIFF